ncbi:MAG: enolase C-terminal domain-like protein [Pseudomonadota bacterium]|nr:enolase C-terminal domain-like protein [Pseudomonadota bacterium]
MKIIRAEVLVVKLPRSSSYTWRSLQVPIGEMTLLRLETDTGLVGLGEAPAIMSWGGEHGRYFGEDSETISYVMRRYFWPVLLNSDPLDSTPLLSRLNAEVRGHVYAKAMLECALLDIVGKALGVPVYQLLGGASRRSIPVCHSVGITSPEDAANIALRAINEGIQHLQVKVPGEPADDLKIMSSIRQAIGDDPKIYPDVNRGYGDAKTAIASTNAMKEEADIAGIEQPVEGRDLMARVTDAIDIPVIIDEGCWSPYDAYEVARDRLADIISIYFTKAGGLQRAVQIGVIANAAGLPVNVNGSLEGGVGNAANLHLCAALEGTVLPAVIPVTTLEGREQNKFGGVFYNDDVITEPFFYGDGMLDVPDGPGLGVELNPEKLEKYLINKVEMNQST